MYLTLNKLSYLIGHPRDGHKRLWIIYIYTMEALVSGHPRVAKMVPLTGAGHFRECENTEFVWESRKTGFFEGGGRK